MSEEKRSEVIITTKVPREPPEGGWPTLPQITRQDLAIYIAANPGALPELMSREEWENWHGGIAGWIDDGGIEKLEGLYQLPDGSVVILGPGESMPASTGQQQAAKTPTLIFPDRMEMEQAEEYLGIKRRKISYLVASGELHRVKIGRRLLFEKKDLDAFLKAHRL